MFLKARIGRALVAVFTGLFSGGLFGVSELAVAKPTAASRSIPHPAPQPHLPAAIGLRELPHPLVPRTGALLKPPGGRLLGRAARIAAANAPARARATVHRITSCGYVTDNPGTYVVTTSLTDTGSGPCILVASSNVTLDLDSHTITGTGSDTCILVSSTNNAIMISDDRIVGGTTTKKGTKPATLSGCSVGLEVDFTSGTVASFLQVIRPGPVAVAEQYAAGMRLQHIDVDFGGTGTGYGFSLGDGADNAISSSTVDAGGTGTSPSFATQYEYADSLTSDTAEDTYSPSGRQGIGFLDEDANQDIYSGDKAVGQQTGFELLEGGSGTVTATGDTATYAGSNGAGFTIEEAYLGSDPGSPRHTVLAGDTTKGFKDGFYDSTSDSGSASVREVYSHDTAGNYAEFGYYFQAPIDYTITDNTADADTTTHRYGANSGTVGFDIDEAFAPLVFSGNRSYDNEFGYGSNSGKVIGGKDNVSLRNEYDSHDVEFTG